VSPEEALARRLAAEIENELGRLDQLADEAASAPQDDSPFGLRARGSILHDFYSGIERVFQRIAEELNGGVPQSGQWHRQLLTDMSLPIPDLRPPPINAALAEELGDFLRFRHLFRNTYGWELRADRIRRLEDRMPGVKDQFHSQVRDFLDWLTGA